MKNDIWTRHKPRPWNWAHVLRSGRGRDQTDLIQKTRITHGEEEKIRLPYAAFVKGLMSQHCTRKDLSYLFICMCVYVCMCLSRYENVWICLHMCECVCIGLDMCACMSLYKYVLLYILILCMNMYVRFCIGIMNMYECVWCVWICTFLYKCEYVCMCFCRYEYVCMCFYRYGYVCVSIGMNM